MVLLTIVVYAMDVAKLDLNQSLKDMLGKKQDIKRNRTVIYAASKVYILVR
jgi:hypothetical protein